MGFLRADLRIQLLSAIAACAVLVTVLLGWQPAIAVNLPWMLLLLVWALGYRDVSH
ncbi:hypothetical protein [Candidatus Igneacidithiobacillus taiwanensis]|uniref:hypothetical protein n=1 Tax=Candidatus Igneacidithiobacillus taiwanensis TaxID=1945924 RepID=UPI00289C79B9|nr:hypothetical protein [Candidatus Igneacidithiobacillus taiwanensis]